jgi:DNA-binding SARP family transcriptional activator
MLLLHANEPVSVDRLADAVWGATPPPTVAHVVSVYVCKLRKLLGAEVIGRAAGGYVLHVPPGHTDRDRFETLVAAAGKELGAGASARACELLDEACAIWRGRALADIALEDVARASVRRVDEQRLAAVETRAEAKLALGRHHEVLGELEDLVGEHPHDERLWGLLILALYRAGRQAEALARYQAVRRSLAEELGIEPSHSLQELERKILTHDPSLDLAREPVETRAVLVVPSRLDQLDELAALGEQLALARGPDEVIRAWLEEPAPLEDASKALGDATVLLARVRASLLQRGGRARIAAFTAVDRAADVLELAGRPEVDLLVLGSDVPGTDGVGLDPETASILASAPCDAAVCFLGDPVRHRHLDGPVLVPFAASEHDWAALGLAAWLAGATACPLVLVGADAGSNGARRDASRLLAEAGLLLQRTTGVVSHPRLVEPGREALLQAVADGGLVVAGLPDLWLSEGIGERLDLARCSPTPVLLVRRGPRPGALTLPETFTPRDSFDAIAV